MRVAGTFFLMQHLEDVLDGDVDKRSTIARQINGAVDGLRERLGIKGVPEFECVAQAGKVSVSLVSEQGLHDLITV